VDGESVKLGAAVTAWLVLGCDARAQTAEPPPPPTTTPTPTQPQRSPVPVTVPAGWVTLPAVAQAGQIAAKVAARDRPLVVRSWGQPSLGCFATIVEITSTRAEHAARLAESFRATLASDGPVDGWTVTDGPTAEASATLTRGALTGAVRGRLATDAAGVPHAVFAACFYNEREPARCQAACTGLLASLERPKVSP
jgi:hypothetical protein